MVPVLLGVALLVFLLFNTVGEDPVRVALGAHATPESILELQKQWGLDKPLPMQFLDFLRQIVTFDYGRSYNTGERLGDTFQQGAVVSLSLTVPPFAIGFVLNVSIGLLVAYYRGSWLDRFATALVGRNAVEGFLGDGHVGAPARGVEASGIGGRAFVGGAADRAAEVAERGQVLGAAGLPRFLLVSACGALVPCVSTAARRRRRSSAPDRCCRRCRTPRPGSPGTTRRSRRCRSRRCGRSARARPRARRRNRATARR